MKLPTVFSAAGFVGPRVVGIILLSNTGSDFQYRQHRSAPLPDEGWWATLYAEIIPFEQRLEMGRVLRHIEYLWFCAKNHGLRQFGGATLLQQRVQHAGYPHTHTAPTERPSLCL